MEAYSDLLQHLVVTFVTIVATAGSTLYITNMLSKHSWEEKVGERLTIIEAKLEFLSTELGKLDTALKTICAKINMIITT